MPAHENGEDLPEHEAIARRNDKFFEEVYSHAAADGVTFDKKDLKGSRLRCLMLTSMPRKRVAAILTRMIEPIGSVKPSDAWAPCGFLEPGEAEIGEHPSFLLPQERETVTSWWLKVREHANTPNWDLVSMCDIAGKRGLILAEAKAHEAELKTEGKGRGNPENDGQIERAIREANSALSSVLPGWALTKDSHYQLCNRFAWAWKVATMGIPVVLVYLGFLHCDEMSKSGTPFDSAQQWKQTILSHSQPFVPANAWDGAPIRTSGAPFWALTRVLDCEWKGPPDCQNPADGEVHRKRS